MRFVLLASIRQHIWAHMSIPLKQTECPPSLNSRIFAIPRVNNSFNTAKSFVLKKTRGQNVFVLLLSNARTI